MTVTDRRRISRHWNKLRKRASSAPHGQKRRREEELRLFVVEQLRREVTR